MVSRWKVRYITPQKSNVCFWEIHFSLRKQGERNQGERQVCSAAHWKENSFFGPNLFDRLIGNSLWGVLRCSKNSFFKKRRLGVGGAAYKVMFSTPTKKGKNLPNKRGKHGFFISRFNLRWREGKKGIYIFIPPLPVESKWEKEVVE